MAVVVTRHLARTPSPRPSASGDSPRALPDRVCCFTLRRHHRAATRLDAARLAAVPPPGQRPRARRSTGARPDSTSAANGRRREASPAFGAAFTSMYRLAAPTRDPKSGASSMAGGAAPQRSGNARAAVAAWRALATDDAWRAARSEIVARGGDDSPPRWPTPRCWTPTCSPIARAPIATKRRPRPGRRPEAAPSALREGDMRRVAAADAVAAPCAAAAAAAAPAAPLPSAPPRRGVARRRAAPARLAAREVERMRGVLELRAPAAAAAAAARAGAADAPPPPAARNTRAGRMTEGTGEGADRGGGEQQGRPALGWSSYCPRKCGGQLLSATRIPAGCHDQLWSD